MTPGSCRCYHIVSSRDRERSMAQILVRNLSEKLVRRIKRRAAAGGRSLQGEVKTILEQAYEEPKLDRQAFLRLADKIRESFKGRRFSDSTKMIREDRDRR